MPHGICKNRRDKIGAGPHLSRGAQGTPLATSAVYQAFATSWAPAGFG
jgi:hypothetical protein